MMNEKEMKGRRKKEKESNRFDSLSLRGLNFKELEHSYCCFNHQVLFFFFLVLYTAIKDLLSHSISLMQQTENYFNCSNFSESWERHNQDASDLAFWKNYHLIEFETAHRNWESWTERHLGASYNFLVLQTTLTDHSFCPCSSNEDELFKSLFRSKMM